MHAQDAAGVLAGRSRFAAEAGRVGGITDRQLVGLEDLVTVQVRDRHLRRGNEIQLVTSDDIHKIFFVRDLARAASRGRVDHGRRPYLRHAVLIGVDVEHEIDEGALQPRARPGIDRKARAGDLCAALQVEHLQVGGDFPVRPARPLHSIGGDVLGKHLAPGADDLIGRLVTNRNVRVGRVRDSHHQFFELRLGRSQFGVDPFYLGAGIG